jgi:hypothetical protein
MHLRREMRRFEMDDLSSRRGDRDRSPAQPTPASARNINADFWRILSRPLSIGWGATFSPTTH